KIIDAAEEVGKSFEDVEAEVDADAGIEAAFVCPSATGLRDGAWVAGACPAFCGVGDSCEGQVNDVADDGEGCDDDFAGGLGGGAAAAHDDACKQHDEDDNSARREWFQGFCVPVHDGE